VYHDQVAIKEQLDMMLVRHFGEQAKHDVNLLLERLRGQDIFIDKHLVLNLQSLLSLQANQAAYFIRLALELSHTSVFAPVLLLEKIPTLFFYGVAEDVGQFLSNIKHYGGRAIALYLGSEQLHTDDLLDVLGQSTPSFYKALLNAVNARHHEFGVCCAMIMRCSANMERVITTQHIEAYLDVCAAVVKRYSTKITEQYIHHADVFLSHVPLEETVFMLQYFENQSLATLEFSVTHPQLFFTLPRFKTQPPLNNLSTSERRAVKLELLTTEDYATILSTPSIVEDLAFTSLVLAWPDLSQPLKNNILFQLQHDNYKHYILTHPDIEAERNAVNHITQSTWLSSWTFSGAVIDLLWIRQCMGQLLREPSHFSIPSKSIIKNHAVLFDRTHTNYTSERIINMLTTLITYCITPRVHDELTAMLDFIHDKPDALRHLLSKKTLVIQAWERDPWVDYGRSDELFACTSLGDYNAGNAPGFLADLNLNHLDIWSAGIRVGRIHLCLIKDLSGEPMLLLDCLDGTERIIGSKKKFEFMMAGVLEYARGLGIKRLKVNFDVDFNTTPKKFIAHIQQTFQGENQIDFASRFLDTGTIQHLIPYPSQTFTESFVQKNGAFIRGPVIALMEFT